MTLLRDGSTGSVRSAGLAIGTELRPATSAGEVLGDVPEPEEALLPVDGHFNLRVQAAQETGWRIWKYRRIAKQALAAAKCLSVCPLRMNPTESIA